MQGEIEVSSRAGLTSNPKFTMTFRDAAKGYATLSAKDSKAAFPSALDHEHLVVSGDFVEVLWFQGLTEYLQPKEVEALGHTFDSQITRVNGTEYPRPRKFRQMRPRERRHEAFVRDAAPAARTHLLRTNLTLPVEGACVLANLHEAALVRISFSGPTDL